MTHVNADLRGELTSANGSQSLITMFGRKRSTVTPFSSLLLRSLTEASDSSITGEASGYATCWINRQTPGLQSEMTWSDRLPFFTEETHLTFTYCEGGTLNVCFWIFNYSQETSG